MSNGAGANGSAHRWEYLIAHHFPDRYRRTLTVPWGTRQYHLCARCTGQALGVLAYVAFVIVALPYLGGFFAPQVQFLFAFAPLPGAIDWVSQAIGRRESTNALRLLTGVLAGATMADGIALIVLQQWALVGAAFLVLAGYILGILLVIRRSGAWVRIIEEHFPGLEFESAP
ncbi:MAG: DUF2085 domain-containing protein [Thermoplasmata archaeon]